MKQTGTINIQRMIDEFVELTSIDALSFEERAFADVLKKKMEALGFEVYEDEANKILEAQGKAIPGKSAGNVYGYLKGELPGTPVLFAAHMDTVKPGLGKKPLVLEDKIVSDGTTVLGADDVSGIVEILEAVRVLKEQQIPHRDIEVLFAAAEEVYCKGSILADYSRLHAQEAYVLDSSGPVGKCITEEPTLISFQVQVRGRAAHAGFSPELGINAIAICADIIGKIQQGRVDQDSVVNIGKISGGEATNIVSEVCTIHGELRSRHHAHALEMLEEIRSICEANKKEAQITFTSEIDLQAYHVEESHAIIQKFQRACHAIGIEPEIATSFGGSDNNSFMRNGITGIVLSCGMQNVHSTKEFLMIEDLRDGAALVQQLMMF